MALSPDDQIDLSHGLDAYDNSDDSDYIPISSEANDYLTLWEKLPAGRPMPELKSRPAVRKEATAWSEKIITNFETLNKIVERHEATIWKRWAKKTRPQRLKILLNAWPNMPAVHRPDFDAYHKESQQERDQGTNYRESFMWPYINQEDLLNTKTLPLLLNARGRHLPSRFASADIDAMHVGFTTWAIVPKVLNGHVMILKDVARNTLEYGRLMSWEEHPDAINWLREQMQFSPGEGLLVLEAQGRLLNFLVQCCLQLLHEFPKSTLTGDTFPVQPEPQRKSESEICGFESLSVMAAEAPYRLPAPLDLHCIESLLSARAPAAEYHLCALREDPEYFSRTLLEGKDHRQELLKDVAGNDHPVLSNGTEEILWERIIGSVVSEAYLLLEFYSELSSQAKRLVSLQQTYADDMSPLQDLPEEYREALLRFYVDVSQTATALLNTLKDTIPASPPLRRLFARVPPPNPHTTEVSVVLKSGIEMDNVEKQLLWLLDTLYNDEQQTFLFGLSVTVDELGRLLQSETRARELLSSYVTAVVGDLSIITHCLKQLDLHYPWARRWNFQVPDRGASFKQKFEKRVESCRIIDLLDDQSAMTILTRLGEPSDGKFTYPVTQRRTKENVKALRNAESHLDAFWTSLDRAMFAKDGDLHGTAIRNLLSQPRILRRTREWVEPKKTKPLLSTQDTLGEADAYTSYEPFSQVFSDFSANTSDVPEPKTKVKTAHETPRPTSKPVAEAKTDLPPNSVDGHPVFSVNSRALKVFRTIFFNPAVTSTPGEVTWNDFLHAMSSVGFTAMKLYGSLWHFQPGRLNVERSIQFHEPHLQAKLSTTTARQYGRRLNMAYGWVGGMFILDKKK